MNNYVMKYQCTYLLPRRNGSTYENSKLKAPNIQTGLGFGKEEVLERVNNKLTPSERQDRIILRLGGTQKTAFIYGHQKKLKQLTGVKIMSLLCV